MKHFSKTDKKNTPQILHWLKQNPEKFPSEKY